MPTAPAVADARAELVRRLRAVRHAANLTQTELANAVFTSRSTIACIETGRQSADRDFWVRADRVTCANGSLLAAYDRLQALRLDASANILVGTALTRSTPCDPGKPMGSGFPDLAHGGGGSTGDWSEADSPASVPWLHLVADQLRAGAPTSRLVSQPVHALLGQQAIAERSQELFVRSCGLLATNDRREIETAKVLLDRAVMREPQFARAIAARGYASWRQYFAGWTAQSQALNSAVSDIHEALTIDPESILAHLTFIRVSWDMGWHERALAAGRYIFERNPESLDATIAFARALNNAGLSQYALPLVDSVLTVDPSNPTASKLNVWCHLMVGNFEHAVGVARPYLRGHPPDANTRWATALACRHLNDGASALDAAAQAADADPDDTTVWVLLGYLRRWLGDRAAARAAWMAGLDRIAGVQLSNNRIKAWAANLHAALGNDSVASRMAHEIQDDEPANGYLCYRLAHVYAELGHSDMAVKLLEQAADSGFLSVQLVRREEALATATICGLAGYQDAVQRLERRVKDAAGAYAAGLTHVPVTALVASGDPI